MSARLDELERLEKAAAKTPWVSHKAKTWSHVKRGGLSYSLVLQNGDERDTLLVAALRNAAPALLAIARAAEEADAHIFGNRDGMPELDDWKWLTALQAALAALDGTPEGDS